MMASLSDSLRYMRYSEDMHVRHIADLIQSIIDEEDYFDRYDLALALADRVRHVGLNQDLGGELDRLREENESLQLIIRDLSRQLEEEGYYDDE